GDSLQQYAPANAVNANSSPFCNCRAAADANANVLACFRSRPVLHTCHLSGLQDAFVFGCPESRAELVAGESEDDAPPALALQPESSKYASRHLCFGAGRERAGADSLVLAAGEADFDLVSAAF
ncbi:unnamed protein product, partial [Polarella glacialis]